MNNLYPEWWDTTLTIYNKFEDPITHVIRWYRTVLTNCFWKYTGNKIKVGNVTLETDNSICRIPKNSNFLEKGEWITRPNDEKGNYFTIARGDIIIKGDVADTIDEYTSGSRSTDLEKKYKELSGCIRIEEMTINTGTGRCAEHYYVTGV